MSTTILSGNSARFKDSIASLCPSNMHRCPLSIAVLEVVETLALQKQHDIAWLEVHY